MRRHINETTKGIPLHGKTSYDVQIVKIGSPVRPVRVTDQKGKTKSEEKPYCGKLHCVLAQTTQVIGSKSSFAWQ